MGSQKQATQPMQQQYWWGCRDLLNLLSKNVISLSRWSNDHQGMHNVEVTEPIIIAIYRQPPHLQGQLESRHDQGLEKPNLE